MEEIKTNKKNSTLVDIGANGYFHRIGENNTKQSLANEVNDLIMLTQRWMCALLLKL